MLVRRSLKRKAAHSHHRGRRDWTWNCNPGRAERSGLSPGGRITSRTVEFVVIDYDATTDRVQRPAKPRNQPPGRRTWLSPAAGDHHPVRVGIASTRPVKTVVGEGGSVSLLTNTATMHGGRGR